MFSTEKVKDFMKFPIQPAPYKQEYGFTVILDFIQGMPANWSLISFTFGLISKYDAANMIQRKQSLPIGTQRETSRTRKCTVKEKGVFLTVPAHPNTVLYIRLDAWNEGDVNIIYFIL